MGTVKDGNLVVEERGLRESDWDRYDIASASGDALGNDSFVVPVVELTPEEKAEQERKRKLAFNAPKRIKKIEDMIAKAELKISEYDEKMLEHGSDTEKLMEFTNKKAKEEKSVAKLMEEWEMLEEVIAEMSAA